MGRVPEGHFLKKIDGQIDWRPFEKVLEPLYHPKLGRPSHPPVVMFKALLLQQWYSSVRSRTGRSHLRPLVVSAFFGSVSARFDSG